MLTRAKIVWALGRMVPLVRSAIFGTRFIPTEDKDQLFKKFEEVNKTLLDALAREHGKNPWTPDMVKKWSSGIKAANKARDKSH